MRYDKRRTGPAVAVVALVTVGLVTVGLAACGSGSPGPGVAGAASAPSASASASASGAQGSRTAQGLAYTQCMRSHGVTNFPDPVATGKSFKFPLAGLNINSPQFQSAKSACRHLAPVGQPNPAQQQETLSKMLKYAQCMRAHGISMSDPKQLSNGFFQAPRASRSEQATPQYQSARQACQADLGRGGGGGGS